MNNYKILEELIIKYDKKVMKLEQENKQLKEDIKSQSNYQTIIDNENAELRKEKDNLKIILIELEEWLKEQLMYFCENNEQGGFSTNVEDLEMILDKIQELNDVIKN